MTPAPEGRATGAYAFLGPYIRSQAGAFALAVCFLSLEAACDLFQPTIMARVIDQGVAARDLTVVLGLGSLMLLVTALGALAATARNIISSRVSQRFGTALRGDLYRRVQSFSFTVLSRFDKASLVTRLTNDVTQVQNFANGLMRIFVKAPLLAIGGIVMAVILNPRLSLVLVAVVPVVAFLIFVSLRTSFPFYRRIQAALDRVNGVMREYLDGVRVVKAFNRFDHEEARFAAANDELSLSSISAMRVMALFSPFIQLAMSLGICAVLWFGGAGVRAGGMKVGQVVAFVNYMTQITGSLMMLSFIFNMFVRARASAERIGEVLVARSESPGAAARSSPGQGRAMSLDASGWGLRFEGVTLRYDGASESALCDINFTCAPGETVGIIGSTGSGKSTLVGLIPRFHEPSSGRVLVDGIDLAGVDLRSLREGVAVVPQRSLLFTGTIRDNLLWGRADATEEELVAAAKAAQAHEFIMSFPEGYSSRVGRGGLSLSGGQRQRVAIARALVRRPRILILDDSTSAVDSVTEARIRESLRSERAGATVFLIAQRVSSVRSADRVLVLDGGALVGSGRHEELLAGCEVYQDIHRSQTGVREASHG